MQLFPTIRGHVGNWIYYSTKMTASALSEGVKFASEFSQPRVLDEILQRALNDTRAKVDIARYLETQEGRFFNSIVIAAWEGKPTFFPVNLTDDPRFEMVADKRFMEAFGVLRFDGHQKYYALDGQHRLKAIKTLLLNEDGEFNVPPNFGFEEFPVVIVVPATDESFDHFMPRYRRLFSNLNRYAKAMDRSTIVAMDEDDPFAITTRRLISEYKYFQWFADDSSSRLKVQGSKAINENENYFITLLGLYEMNSILLWSAQRTHDHGRSADWIKLGRPNDAVLDTFAQELKEAWDGILEELPALKTETITHFRSSAGEDTTDEGKVHTNHLLFRPIGHTLLARIVRMLMNKWLAQRSQRESVRGLHAIEWRLYEAPWRHLLSVYDPKQSKWKMRTEKEAQLLALNLLAYITGVTPHDEATLEVLRQTWVSQLQGAPAEYAEDGWRSVLQMRDSYPD